MRSSQKLPTKSQYKVKREKLEIFTGRGMRSTCPNRIFATLRARVPLANSMEIQRPSVSDLHESESSEHHRVFYLKRSLKITNNRASKMVKRNGRDGEVQQSREQKQEMGRLVFQSLLSSLFFISSLLHKV